MQVENSGTHLVQNKGQVHDSDRVDLLQQGNQLQAGLFLPQVHADKTNGALGFRRVNVNAEDREIAYLRQQASPQVAGHAGD